MPFDLLMQLGSMPSVDRQQQLHAQAQAANKQQGQSGVRAAPSIYIDVVIGEQKQVYELTTAFQLRDALNAALSAFDEAQQTAEGTAQTAPPTAPPIPGAPDPAAADAEPPAADADAPPAA